MDSHGSVSPARHLGGTPRPGRVPFGSPARERSTVEIPSWVLDVALAPATPSAFRLCVLLYRLGHPVVDDWGNRRLWWKGSLVELARATGVSKPHLIEAERFLANAGVLEIHQPLKPGASHAVSVLLSGPGNDSLPAADSALTQHGGDPLSAPETLSESEITTTTAPPTREEAVTLCDRLSAIGVTAPQRWLKTAGPARLAEALDYFATLDLTGVRNPAGVLHGIVFGRHRIPTPAATRPDRIVNANPLASLPTFSTLEERMAKYAPERLK